MRESIEPAEDGVKLTSAVKPNQLDSMHYSFDFAQQVHYPANPRQPGPIYFLVPRKCGLFGICCEGVGQQVNFLIDEGSCIGKGSNAVISYLHHFFEAYGLGEDHVDLHCDNCSGQNKNRYVLWYFCWRVLNGYHKSVSVHFMVSGHTKFAPDGGFGLVKRRFTRTEVNCLEDIKNIVESSSKSNIAQIVGWEDQRQLVTMYDWQRFFGNNYRPLEGMKAVHHFRFSQDHPGVVFYKTRVHDDEKSANVLRNRDGILPVIGDEYEAPIPGLSLARQKYLYEKIREFCLTDESKDKTCPAPIE